MGNLCSCAGGGAEAAASGTAAAGADGIKPVGSAGAAAGGGLPEQASAGAPPLKSKPSGKAAAVQQANPIDLALQEARKELEKNAGLDFNDSYRASKLIGHGAFAKVMVCTTKDGRDKYAVKTVQKNLEDPQKQREGRDGGMDGGVDLGWGNGGVCGPAHAGGRMAHVRRARHMARRRRWWWMDGG